MWKNSNKHIHKTQDNALCERCCPDVNKTITNVNEQKYNLDEKVIEVEDLFFSYDGQNIIFRNLKFNIKRGDFVLIYGPNGTGKTTLLKLLLGFLIPQKGTIKLFGIDSRDLNIHNKLLSKISYLHQTIVDKEDNLPLSVMDVVLSGYLSNSKNLIFKYTKEMYENAYHILKHFSLFELKDEKITNLSIGQRQRVFLARALISNPDLLILDEPTVGIDKESNEAFYNYLKHLNEVHKITIILVSHDFSQAINFVNEVLYLGNNFSFLKPKEEAIHFLKNL